MPAMAPWGSSCVRSAASSSSSALVTMCVAVAARLALPEPSGTSSAALPVTAVAFACTSLAFTGGCTDSVRVGVVIGVLWRWALPFWDWLGDSAQVAGGAFVADRIQLLHAMVGCTLVVILVVAVGILWWLRRSGSAVPVASLGPRRQGVVKRYSQKNGWGVIACDEDIQWDPSPAAHRRGGRSRALRFYREDKETLDLSVGDVVQFTAVLDVVEPSSGWLRASQLERVLPQDAASPLEATPKLKESTPTALAAESARAEAARARQCAAAAREAAEKKASPLVRCRVRAAPGSGATPTFVATASSPARASPMQATATPTSECPAATPVAMRQRSGKATNAGGSDGLEGPSGGVAGGRSIASGALPPLPSFKDVGAARPLGPPLLPVAAAKLSATSPAVPLAALVLPGTPASQHSPTGDDGEYLRLTFAIQPGEPLGLELVVPGAGGSPGAPAARAAFLVVAAVEPRGPLAQAQDGPGLRPGDRILHVDIDAGACGHKEATPSTASGVNESPSATSLWARLDEANGLGGSLCVQIQTRPTCFEVVLERQGPQWHRLGLSVGIDKKRPSLMRVRAVREHGLAPAWNAANASRRICAGDWITQVNDCCQDALEMYAEVQRSGEGSQLLLRLATLPRQQPPWGQQAEATSPEHGRDGSLCSSPLGSVSSSMHRIATPQTVRSSECSPLRDASVYGDLSRRLSSSSSASTPARPGATPLSSKALLGGERGSEGGSPLLHEEGEAAQGDRPSTRASISGLRRRLGEDPQLLC